MEKDCETCKHASNDHYECETKCDEHYSGWEPKESDIRAAQESIDRAFTAFTDKLKGERMMERSCATCNKDVSSDCAECGDAYYLWEPVPSLTGTQKKISEICDEVKNILLEKNRKYGDSALNPKRVFSKASPIEQINVRIDDKISRIMSAQDDDTEDAELDLIGYLILKRVAKKVADDVQ